MTSEIGENDFRSVLPHAMLSNAKSNAFCRMACSENLVTSHQSPNSTEKLASRVLWRVEVLASIGFRIKQEEIFSILEL